MRLSSCATTVFLVIFQISKISCQLVQVNVGEAVVSGMVEGRSGQREYYAFKGIPYATAERFQDPVLKRIEHPINATAFGESCPQWSKTTGILIGNENCLFLNVFTRVLPDSNGLREGEILHPVMLYLHGGGFTALSGVVAGPRRFMTSEDKVVLVSINHRLGILGFLSTGERDLPGNWGLLDILMSLDWLSKYIRNFGGDPNRITVFGHSSGAAAVHLLTLSPRANGKFHRAIIISGNGFCSANIEPEPLKYTERISGLVGCSTASRPEMIGCLKNQSVSSLLSAQKSLVDFWIHPKYTVPTVDAKSRGRLAVLPGQPVELLEAHRTVPMPMVVGVMKNEGLLGYANTHLYFGTARMRNTSYFRSEIIPRTIRALQKSTKQLPSFWRLIEEHYFKNLNMSDPISFQTAVGGMTEMTDILYYSCHREFLERYASQSNPVYSYVFSHKTLQSPSFIGKQLEILAKDNVTQALFDYGVPHVQDMLSLFESALPMSDSPVLTPLDERVAVAYIRSLITFAKTGTPAGIPDAVADVWEPIRPGNLNYFNITSVSSGMGADFRKMESLFWLQTVPLVQELGEDEEELRKKLEFTEGSLRNFKILFWISFTLGIILVGADPWLLLLGILLWRKR